MISSKRRRESRPAAGSGAGEAFARHTDQKVRDLVERVEASEFYRALADPAAPLTFCRAIMRNILLESTTYGPHIVEATFTAIGRIRKDRPDLMKPLLLHNLDEVNHSELALAGYVRLGGDAAHARSRACPRRSRRR
jgi:hypothetical protein